jgi:hypothetical protein
MENSIDTKSPATSALPRRTGSIPMDRLRKPRSGVETLERLKRWPSLREVPDGVCNEVKIYSGEHSAYWQENGHGYTGEWGDGVWVLPLKEAFEQVKHCCPSKCIEFHWLF